MKVDFTNEIQKLSDLDKKIQDLDEVIKDIQTKIYDVLWDLIELKKSST